MEIETPVSDEAWRRFLVPETGATFFHTPEWARLLERHIRGYRAATFLLHAGDGQILLPCVTSRRTWPLRPGLLSMPWLTYGGPLARDCRLEDHAGCLARALAAMGLSTANLVSPPAAVPPAWSLPSFRRAEQSTHLLELDTDYEDLFARRFEGRLRTAIRKAAKSGVRVSNAVTQEAIDGYWRLETEAGYNAGLAAAFFGDLVRLPGVSLWTAWREERVIGGMVVLAGPRSAHWWRGAMDRSCADLQPSALLMDAVVRALCGRVPRLDLGSSAGLAGVVRFKESTGAACTPFWIDSAARGIARVARGLRDAVRRR